VELRRLLNRVPAVSRLQYADHIEHHGTALFRRVCELDLEGIVAKHKFGPYVSDRDTSSWFKVLNQKYSQRAGREELFERDRRKEPVPGLKFLPPDVAGERKTNGLSPSRFARGTPNSKGEFCGDLHQSWGGCADHLSKMGVVIHFPIHRCGPIKLGMIEHVECLNP